MNAGVRTFTIIQDAPPKTGRGDMVDLMKGALGHLNLSVIRSSKREDNRGRRSISISLDRTEALSLGRQLIAEAAGMVVLDRPSSESRLNLNAWNSDARGRFMVSLAASRVGGEVLLSMDCLRDIAGHFRRDGDVGVILDVEEARDFARSLLAACQD
jgi:hypothetical protein